MEHAFGRGPSFLLGIEEELLLVEPEGHALAPDAERLLPAIDAPGELVAHEAYAAEVELRSPPSRDAAEAAGAVAGLRGAARAAGATLLGCGIHPSGSHGDARLVDLERYRRCERDMRGLMRRTPECALHVHVGMPDPGTAIRAHNGLRRHLPLVAGLAASSPFWFGADSGLASARSALVRAYPGRGVPRAFHDFADYEETVAASLAAGGLEDATLLWWDVRPHPRHGTLEVRELDTQASLADASALAALVHGLALHEADGGDGPAPATEAIAWSSFRAARDGVRAQILAGDRIAPLAEVARTAVGVAAAHLGELGADAGALDGVERIVREGGDAWQRDRHAREGMPGLLAALVERTAAGV
ncbi:MAG: YbdK family carboxylate-amine ligase [Thermoleophilaceae bacterium]